MDIVDSAVHAVAVYFQNALPFQPSVREMQALHVTKPWVEGFKAVLISPLRDRNLEGFTAVPVGKAPDGRVVFVPSAKFWYAHARSSHPPMGRGCDAGAHADFLTPGGDRAEFAYYNLLQDGTIYMVDEEGFEEECSYWASAFPRAAREGADDARRAGY